MVSPKRNLRAIQHRPEAHLSSVSSSSPRTLFSHIVRKQLCQLCTKEALLGLRCDPRFPPARKSRPPGCLSQDEKGPHRKRNGRTSHDKLKRNTWALVPTSGLCDFKTINLGNQTEFPLLPSPSGSSVLSAVFAAFLGPGQSHMIRHLSFGKFYTHGNAGCLVAPPHTEQAQGPA